MKQDDVKMNGTYLAYVGAVLCRVVVVGRHDADRFNSRTRFIVRREGTTKDLIKSRSATALRECKPTRTPESYPHIQDTGKRAVCSACEQGICKIPASLDDLRP
jgi:hypothetical protein